MHSRKDAAPRLGRTRNVILYLRDDVALNLRRGVSAQPHQHHAVQLTLALDAPFDAAVGAATGQYWGVLIDRDVPHRIAAHEHWTATFFINPETAIGEAVRRRLLHGTRCQTINQGMMRAIIDSLRGSLQEPLTCAQYEAVLHDLIGSLSLDDQVIFAPDPRIAQALVIIQDLPDKKIAAQELAALVFLSKGRFEHLFKAEIGVPLRSYLLWQRLCTAIARSWQGRTFTAAAHEAGFTDSAHLSRTCRQMFGISPSDVILRQGEAQIIVCGNEIQPMSDDDT